MKPKKLKRLRITERDYILANRKAAREEEILAHGKPVSFRSHFHKIKKKYDRKQLKKAISDTTDDGFFIHLPSIFTANEHTEVPQRPLFGYICAFPTF